MNIRIGGITRHLLGAGLLACGILCADAAAQSNVLTPLAVINSGTVGAAPLAISADGEQAYVGSITTGSLTAYQRDGTGNYAPGKTYTTLELLGSTGQESLQSLVVSSDGQTLYASYEPVDQSAAVLATLHRDAAGTLSIVQKTTLSGSTRLSGLALSPDGAELYSVDQNSLYIFNRNSFDGRLTERQHLIDNNDGVDGLAGAWDVAVSPDPDGSYLYVSGSNDQSIAVLSRDTSGQISFLAVYKNGIGGVSGLADARGVVISADGKQVYVAGAGDNAVAAFNRDTATGLLHPYQIYQDGSPGFDGLSGASALALSPEGSQLYVLGSGEDALTVMHRDSVNGSLAQTTVLRQGQTVPLVDGLKGTLDLAVTPDGKQLLVTSPVEDSLSTFKVAAADLNLVMQADSGPVTAGDAAHFQLVVANNGPDNAGDVVVMDSLPAGVDTADGVFGINQACTLIAAQLQCAIGNLATGQQAILDISVNYPSPGSYINIAVAAAAQRDPQLGNNRTQTTVQIATSQNHGPVAVADQATTLPGVAMDIPVLANDYDPDNNTFTLTALDVKSQQDGTLSINSNGSVHYIPPVAFHGIDSFTYTITDSTGASALGIVQVTVNTQPVAKDDSATIEGGGPAIIYVLANDLDVDGDPLRIIAVQNPSAQGGTLSANGDGTVTYTPPANYAGSDTFSYTVDDGYGGTATARVALAVTMAAARTASGDVPKDSSGQSADGSGGGSICIDELLLLTLVLLVGKGRRSMALGKHGMKMKL